MIMISQERMVVNLAALQSGAGVDQHVEVLDRGGVFVGVLMSGQAGGDTHEEAAGGFGSAHGGVGQAGAGSGEQRAAVLGDRRAELLHPGGGGDVDLVVGRAHRFDGVVDRTHVLARWSVKRAGSAVKVFRQPVEQNW
jgi:hypothetical protein